MQRFWLALVIVALAAGCVPHRKGPETAPVLTPPPSEPLEAVDNPGSIFDPGQADLLFADNRARRLGDIVMIQIVETSEGTHTADTDSSKESSIQIGVESFFNHKNVRATPFGIPSFGLNGPVGPSPMVKGSTSSELSATGETTREAELTATVGARVVKVLPNGLLQVEGAREVRINEETQILVVRGLIRPEDIGPDNSITSNYIADAKIEYYGQGVLADKQRPGWLTRILDNIWPF